MKRQPIPDRVKQEIIKALDVLRLSQSEVEKVRRGLQVKRLKDAVHRLEDFIRDEP